MGDFRYEMKMKTILKWINFYFQANESKNIVCFLEMSRQNVYVGIAVEGLRKAFVFGR